MINIHYNFILYLVIIVFIIILVFLITNIKENFDATTSSLAETTSSLAETTSSLAGTTSSLAETTSSLAGTTSSLEGTTSSLAETTSSLERTTSSLEGTTSSLEGTTSSLEGTRSSSSEDYIVRNTHPALENNLKKNIIDRLFREPEIKQIIINDYKNTVKKLRDETINEKYDKLSNTILEVDKIKNNLPEKFKLLADKVRDMNVRYKKNKEDLETLFIKNNQMAMDQDEFNKKNLIFKNKLDFFKKNISKEEQNNLHKNLRVLKNISNNGELMLLIIKKDSRDNLVYTLALNNGCLRSIQKGEYFIDVCHNENSQFHFNLIEIDSIVAYNEHILNSGNATNKDLIHRLDKSINYPFYILSPTNIRGYAVSYQDNNIYIKPLRNDAGQRFAIKRSSSVC